MKKNIIKRTMAAVLFAISIMAVASVSAFAACVPNVANINSIKNVATYAGADCSALLGALKNGNDYNKVCQAIKNSLQSCLPGAKVDVKGCSTSTPNAVKVIINGKEIDCSGNVNVQDIINKYNTACGTPAGNNNANNGNGNTPVTPNKPVETPQKPAQPVQPQKPVETPQKPAQPAQPQKPVETPSGSSVLAIEREVVELVNQIRASYGLGKLTLNEELSRVARIKAEDMAKNRYFSHTSPTYGSPFDMIRSFGISYRTAGENIAMGYSTAKAVVDAWMNSEGHRANILNASFTQIGVGYTANGNYWCQMFIG